MSDYVVIEWRRDALRLLAAEIADSHVRLQSSVILPWGRGVDSAKDPQGTGDWLRSELDRLRLADHRAVVLLPHGDVALRMLALPDASDEALPDLVRYQTSARSTVPVDQLVLDYLPLSRPIAEGGRSVLSAMVPSKLVQYIQQCAKVAGLELCSIGSSAIAICETIAQVQRHRGEVDDLPHLVVVAADDRLELSLLCGRDVLFSHVVRGGVAEVQRVLMSHDVELGSEGVAHIWLVRSEDAAPDLSTDLAERLACEVTTLDPFVELPYGEFPGESPAQAAEFAASLGAVLGVRAPVVPQFDFLNPRGHVRKPDRTKLYAGLAIAAAIAIATLFYVGTRMHLASLKDQITKRERAEKKLDAILKQGQPTLELNAQLDAWERQRSDWLGEMVRVGDAMPGTDRLYLSRWRFDTAAGDIATTLQASGVARARQDVESLNDQLASQAGLRIRPKPIGENQGDEEYSFDFQLDAEAASTNGKQQ